MAQIIDKIKKLLNMTEENGCTPAEAQRALALAHKLLAQNNLSEDSLGVEEDEIVSIPLDFDTKSPSIAQKQITAALAQHFGCVSLTNKHSTYLMGEREKAEVCKAVAEFVYREFLKEWKVYSKTLKQDRGTKIAYRNTYMEGFISGVISEIVNNEAKGALVIARSQKLLDKVANFKVGHTSYNVTRDALAKMQGFKDGARVQRGKYRTDKIEVKN